MNWEQFKALLWLRWRLVGSRWRRSSDLSRAFSVLFMVLGVCALVGVLFGSAAAGWFGLADASPQTHLFTWDVGIGVFLFFWIIGLVTELQRSESIDTAKLMHLPVSLPQLLVLNFVASLCVPSILVLSAATIGLTAGMLKSGFQWILLGLPVAGLVFAVASWTFSLRGWLAVLMANARRKRAILVTLTLATALLGQLPNLLLNNPWARNRMRHQVGTLDAKALQSEQTRAIHVFIPPAWPAYAISGLAQGEILPIFTTTATLGVIGSLGLWAAFRQANRLYGQTVSGAKRSSKESASVSASPAGALHPIRQKLAFNDRDLPWLPPEATTLALTFLRSHLRAPELRIMLASPLIMSVVFASVFFRQKNMTLGKGSLALMLPGAVVMSLIGLTTLFANQFGFDRHGFRALVLLPTSRKIILLGKNLSVLPLAAPIGLLFAAAGSLASGTGLGGFAGAFGLWFAGFTIMCIVGNWASIYMPSRVNPGAMRRGNQDLSKVMQGLLFLVVQMTALSPLMLPAGIYFIGGGTPLAAILAGVSVLLIAGAVVSIYWATLPALGDSLEKRERSVLDEVTREIE